MLDLSVIGIIVFFGIIGYHKGLIKTIITLISSVAALILSFLMYPVVSSFLTILPSYNYVNEWVSKRVGEIDFGTGMQTQGTAIAENVNWLPRFISEQLIKNNNQEVYKLLGVSSVADYISVYLTRVILSMLAVLITWLIIKMLFVVFLRTADALVSHLPIVSTTNKIGGFGIGIAKGLLTIWIVCLLIPFIITYPAFEQVGELIEHSQLARWLYENNMILQVFQSVFNI